MIARMDITAGNQSRNKSLVKALNSKIDNIVVQNKNKTITKKLLFKAGGNLSIHILGKLSY